MAKTLLLGRNFVKVLLVCGVLGYVIRQKLIYLFWVREACGNSNNDAE